MYFPIGWPRQLWSQDDGSALIHVGSSSETKHLFSVLTHNTIAIWSCKPSVQIVSFRRSDNSVSQFGENLATLWKPDDTMIALTTSKGYIIFFRVENETKSKNVHLFTQQENKKPLKSDTMDMGSDQIKALRLLQTAYIQVAGGVHSLLCVKDDLMVTTGIGWLQRIRWDGMINGDLTIEVSSIPFSIDFQHSRASQLTSTDVFIKQIEQLNVSTCTGFAVVLSDGRAAYITAGAGKFEPNNVYGVWATHVRDATTVAVSDKFNLMAFGCKSGEGIVCHFDNLTSSVAVSHKLVVSSKDFPDCLSKCGSVTSLKWTPDGQALAMAWEKGGFSLWSAFGALLLHSLHVDMGGSFSDSLLSNPHVKIKSMEWGKEGYHLWLVSELVTEESHKHLVVENNMSTVNLPKLLQLNFVKSALSVNQCMSNHEHLFLQGDDRLYLSTEDTISQMPNVTSSAGNTDCGQAAFLMNKQWQIVQIPHAYLTQNWPVRFAAVNHSGRWVAVAGAYGLAHYALYSRKWKLFGNETQERQMRVNGGLTWWGDFICAACKDLEENRYEIRFYPRESKLDNRFAEIVKVPSEVQLLNTFHDLLVVLCADSHIMLFRLVKTSEQPLTSGHTPPKSRTETDPKLEVVKIQEVAVGNFISQPSTVLSVILTTIRTETAPLKLHQQPDDAESIIFNVAGRLLMFQRDRSGPQVKSSATRDMGHKERPLPFCAPVMVASSVENMWYCAHKNKQKPHLTDALWLGCGAAGMRVWLPLHPKEDVAARGFMSRRIMLPFRVDIYPLAVVFEAGILLGASSESQSYHSSQAVVEEGWTFHQLERTNQVYLHHVLRQLLRRNLGVHALEVAHSCTDLKYFAHVLELLIHEVLDEEATSKEPIPDPLLPRVVAFVQEFPEFFQVIAHSARKTEVALWQYFFSVVGSPKDLFEDCLEHNELDTAASYLIILQNMEKPSVARQHATLLLDASLEKCKWDLARDLVRFLKAIDPSEADSPVPTAKSRISSGSVYQASYPSPPSLSPEEGSQFVYPTPSRVRTTSMMKEEKETKPKERSKLTKSNSDTGHVIKKRSSGDLHHRNSDGGNSSSGMSAEQFFIDTILNRHARKLLSAYRLRDLASFAANLEDYQLVSWLRKEKLRAARVEDFVTALKKLHEDFRWPLPILSLNELHRLASQNSLSSAVASEPLSIDIGEPSSQKFLLSSSPNNNASSDTSKRKSSTPDSGSTSEVLLKPQKSRAVSEEGSFVTLTELSDSNSLMADTEMSDSSVWTDSFCLTELEQVSQELANKGPEQSEIELRFLYQLMIEAGCLEWAILIAVVLRDSISVIRVVNMASMMDTPIEIVGRMREGLSFLELWGDTECFGYKPFLQSISGQSRQLQSIIEANLPTSRMSYPSSSVSSSQGGRTRTISTSSTDSARTLEQQPSMERDMVLVEGDDVADELNASSRKDNNDSTLIEQNLQEEGGCVIS